MYKLPRMDEPNDIPKDNLKDISGYNITFPRSDNYCRLTIFRNDEQYFVVGDLRGGAKLIALARAILSELDPS